MLLFPKQQPHGRVFTGLLQNTTDWVAYKQQKLISYDSGVKEAGASVGSKAWFMARPPPRVFPRAAQGGVGQPSRASGQGH